MSPAAGQGYPNEGARLTALAMRERGLSCADVDRLCGFGESSGTTSRYVRLAGQEGGERTPDRLRALAIERVLGVAVGAWDMTIEETRA